MILDEMPAHLKASAIRAVILERSTLNYDSLETTAREIFAGFRAIVDEHINNGYTRDGFNIPTVVPPIDWFAFNRSYAFHLHAFDGITDLLTGYSAYGDERCWALCLPHAKGWINEFQILRLGHESPEELDALVLPEMPTEWYDMAVGQRAYRIAYMIEVMCRRADGSDADIEIFWKALRFHLLLLNREHFFRAHTNHGLYQALGHLAAARRLIALPGMRAEYDLAKRRILIVLAEHFSDDGPHKEHSPGYHYMLMGTLINARRCGLLDDGDLASRIGGVEAALPWMIKPDIRQATFGDTDPRHMVRGEKIAGLYRDEELRYYISGGTVGRLPPTGVRAYLDAGYAFARLYAPDVTPDPPNASYLAQQAGFHSRVHKHADHLSFVWYDRHRDILIDPARYAYAGKTPVGSELHAEGFWYADPKRIYCETTRAHNCVEIDGRSYQRNRVKPFGSALLAATEQDGLAVTDCEMTVFKSVRHRRHLIMAPGHFLLVLDWLYDRSGEAHDYRQWFHFDNPWDVKVDGALVRARHAGNDKIPALDITAASLLPGPALGAVVRGQEEPLLGWQSDKPYSLIPSSCFDLHQRSAEPTIFATLFTLGPELVVDGSLIRFNATMKVGRAAWADHLGHHVIDIARGENDQLKVRKTTKSGRAGTGMDGLPVLRR
jgi:Heparinase II/III-like protein